MKEVRFRAWSKIRKEMLEIDSISMDIDGDGSTDNQITGYNNVGEWDIVPLENVELMQYIGIKDINRKEIYEGDIIRTKDFYNEGELIFKSETYVVPEMQDLINRITHIDSGGEVIGNKFENEDLLDAGLY